MSPFVFSLLVGFIVPNKPKNYRCQFVSDCGAIVSKENRLEMRMPARSYKKGEYGIASDVTYPAYVVYKCPLCRGSLTETESPINWP